MAGGPILAGNSEIRLGPARLSMWRRSAPIAIAIRIPSPVLYGLPEIIADHRLVVFKTSRTEDHGLLCFDIYPLVSVFCEHQSATEFARFPRRDGCTGGRARMSETRPIIRTRMATSHAGL